MTRDADPGGEPDPSYPHLFRPGRIGLLQLSNRVLMAPMEKNVCTADGVISPRYIDYLVERARSDVALLRVEATYVDPVGKGRPFQAGAHSDRIIPALSELVANVHAAADASRWSWRTVAAEPMPPLPAANRSPRAPYRVSPAEDTCRGHSPSVR